MRWKVKVIIINLCIDIQPCMIKGEVLSPGLRMFVTCRSKKHHVAHIYYAG